MTTTIAVVNNKGGVGKTFNTTNLAMKLARKGFCIAIDNDPQGNLSSIFAPSEIKEKNTSSSLYTKGGYITAYPATARVDLETEDREIVENLFISTANDDLSKAHKEAPATAIFNIANAVRKAGEEYKYCIIDCPPGKGIAQDMALFAADIILIPMNPDYFSLEGVKSLIGSINDISHNRPSAPVVRMFLNGTTHSNRHMRDVIGSTMHSLYPDYMSHVEIPYQQAFANASSYLFPITIYSRLKKVKSKASAAHDLLLQELDIF